MTRQVPLMSHHAPGQTVPAHTYDKHEEAWQQARTRLDWSRVHEWHPHEDAYRLLRGEPSRIAWRGIGAWQR